MVPFLRFIHLCFPSRKGLSRHLWAGSKLSILLVLSQSYERKRGVAPSPLILRLDLKLAKQQNTQRPTRQSLPPRDSEGCIYFLCPMGRAPMTWRVASGRAPMTCRLLPGSQPDVHCDRQYANIIHNVSCVCNANFIHHAKCVHNLSSKENGTRIFYLTALTSWQPLHNVAAAEQC